MNAVDGLAGRLTRRRDPTPRTVLAISSLGVFMAFLDATIVNIAFPDIRRSFPEARDLDAVVDPQRLQHRLRGVPRRRRPPRGPARPARMFLSGLALFTFASGSARSPPSAETLIAAPPVQALGAALLVPASLALVLAGLPLRAPRARRRAARRPSARWPPASARRSAACWSPPATGGSSSSSTSRSASRAHRPPRRSSSRAARPAAAGCRTCSARCCSRSRSPLLVLGVVKGEDWGWTSTRVLASLRRRARARRGVRAALHAAPLADHRPCAAADPLVHRRELADDPRRRGLLRLHARQRPVPDAGLAVLGPRGGPRDDARAVRRRGGRRADEPARGALRLPPDPGRRAA